MHYGKPNKPVSSVWYGLAKKIVIPLLVLAQSRIYRAKLCRSPYFGSVCGLMNKNLWISHNHVKLLISNHTPPLAFYCTTCRHYSNCLQGGDWRCPSNIFVWRGLVQMLVGRFLSCHAAYKKSNSKTCYSTDIATCN